MSRYEKLLLALFFCLLPFHVFGLFMLISVIEHDYPFKEINYILFIIFFVTAVIATIARKVFKWE